MWHNKELIKFGWRSGSSKTNAGNDPEAFGLALHHQGPTFINAYIAGDNCYNS